MTDEQQSTRLTVGQGLLGGAFVGFFVGSVIAVVDPLVIATIGGGSGESGTLLPSIIVSVSRLVPFCLAVGVLGGILMTVVFRISSGVGRVVAAVLPWLWAAGLLSYVQVIIFAGQLSYERVILSALIAVAAGVPSYLLLRGTVRRLGQGRTEAPTIAAVLLAILLCVPLLIFAITGMLGGGH
ncbi:MAG: hypothetical protein ACYS8X_04230 [Planctomycetota bacterium]|jgi:hypothetical protein